MSRRSNVVQIKRTRTGYKVAEDVMNDLRMRLYGARVKDIADAMEVSTACVYGIRAGRTQWPRPKTFFALLDYLGLEFMLYDPERGRFL